MSPHMKSGKRNISQSFNNYLALHPVSISIEPSCITAMIDNTELYLEESVWHYYDRGTRKIATGNLAEKLDRALDDAGLI